MPKVTGTFSTIEASAALEVNAEHITISLAFTSTGSVDLQRSYDGTNWNTVATYTENTEKNGFEPASGMQYRLNCTAQADDIDYLLGTEN